MRVDIQEFTDYMTCVCDEPDVLDIVEQISRDDIVVPSLCNRMEGADQSMQETMSYHFMDSRLHLTRNNPFFSVLPDICSINSVLHYTNIPIIFVDIWTITLIWAREEFCE
jgi:hypothetical protein